MFLISYYLEKGHNLKDLLNLTQTEKVLMLASAQFNVELANKKEQNLLNGLSG